MPNKNLTYIPISELHSLDNPRKDYALLQTLGYQMSDEEMQLQDGTYELFQEAENADT